MDGVLNVVKPSGLTSFQVVRLIRKASGERKVGHTGTLDPSAQGVLVLCLGRATRVAGYLLSKDKEYRATIKLGERTDTDDATGRIVSSSSVPSLGKEEIGQICRDFLGEIDQIPPLFSAVRVMGERLYRIARRGGKVTPKAKRVEIKEIELLDLKPPVMAIRILCSKGTYIRSLARDIGENIGCGAHLLSLVRTRVGDFGIEEGVEVGRLRDVETIGEYLIPITTALKEYPQLAVEESAIGAVTHGRAVTRQAVGASAGVVEGGVVLLRNRSGRVLALAKVEGTLIKPFKVLI